MINEPAAIYVRVSGEKQKDNFSIPEQVAMCLAECDVLGLSAVEEYIIRDTFTGSKLSRPQFDKLKALPVKHIVVITQNRLSRADELDTMQCIRELNAAGKTVHAVDSGIMHTSGFEGTMTYLKAVIARVERENIKANTTRGRVGRAKKGMVQSGPTAKYGYDADRTNGTLIINED